MISPRAARNDSVVDGHVVAVADRESVDLDRGSGVVLHDGRRYPWCRTRRESATGADVVPGAGDLAANVVRVIDVRRIRTDPDAVRAALARRGDGTDELDRVVELDERSRQLGSERDDLRARVNALSKEVGGLRRDGDVAAAEAKQAESRELGEAEKALAAEADDVGAAVRDLLLRIPNLPAADAPDGAGPERQPGRAGRGSRRRPGGLAEHQRVPHWDIGAELGILDLERAVKISGSMFTMFRGPGRHPVAGPVPARPRPQRRRSSRRSGRPAWCCRRR